jgi:hypothetical protein
MAGDERRAQALSKLIAATTEQIVSDTRERLP